MVKDDKLYQLLGVTIDAMPDDLKKQYRMLALKFHPDKNPGKLAEKKFKEIKDAYEILMDPQKRETYDHLGMEGLEDRVCGAQGGKGGCCSGHDDHAADVAYSDLLCGAIPRGGCKPRYTAYYRTPGKGRDVFHHLKVPLKDFYTGATKKVTIHRRKIEGFKYLKEHKHLEATIEKGAAPGEQIRFEGYADEYPGMKPGDLVLVIGEKEEERDALYERRGNELIMALSITLSEALTGFTRKLTTLDDRNLALCLPPGMPMTFTEDEDRLKTIPGEGMPIWRCPKGRKGNLIITFDIQFPPPEYFMNPQCLQALSMVLPPKPDQIQPDENTRPVFCQPYDQDTATTWDNQEMPMMHGGGCPCC